MQQKRILWPAVIAGIIFIGLLSFFLGSGVFTSKETSPTQSGSQLQVLTTFFPIYDFAKQVGGDRVNLDILFSQTPEVSSFSSADIQKINNADFVIKNGAGFEPVLDELIVASDNTDIVVVDTSKGIATLSPDEGIELEEHEGEEERGHGSIEPHIWLDPNNAIIQVGNIRDAFIVHDPQNADFYRKNAEQYIAELRALDQEIREITDMLPKKDFVSFHSAFKYFAKRYNLKQAAVIEEFPGKEPSPRYLSELIKLIRELNITAIFSEPQFSPKVVEVIAQDLNLKVYALDPVEAGDLEKDSYISIMRKNLEILREALQ